VQVVAVIAVLYALLLRSAEPTGCRKESPAHRKGVVGTDDRNVTTD
jgi:hypothetical protein